jgi:hypothetical protein
MASPAITGIPRVDEFSGRSGGGGSFGWLCCWFYIDPFSQEKGHKVVSVWTFSPFFSQSLERSFIVDVYLY